MPDSSHIPLASLFDGHVEVSPPLTEEQLRDIPTKRGVFLMAAEGDRPILLTTAASIRGRLRGRLEEQDEQQKASRSADLREITRTVWWKLAGGHFETDWRYLEIARSIWPRSYAKLISWKAPWFVRVNPAAAYPCFERTRDVLGGGGRCFGPFETARSAEKFVEIIQDAFDLCRDPVCLRRSPHAPRCAYGQMGRCLSPCDGTVSMDAYRQQVARAADFAAGDREPRTVELGEMMRQAAAGLEFEQASALKARLERMAELDAPVYRHVAPAEEFRFLMIQPSGSRRRAEVFLAAGGRIAQAKPLDYPLEAAKVQRRIGRMGRFVAAGADEACEPDDASKWRMGLVSRALFAGPRRGGLLIRWHEGLTAEAVIEAVDAAGDELRLSRKGRKEIPSQDNDRKE